MRRAEIHGYAIVSDDDMIADATDQVPMSLRNPQDWEQYQAAQARSALVVFARISHQNEPNTRGDRRLVVSRSVAGLEKRDDAWWWSPAAVAWDEVAATLLPDGGEVAACGGQGVFDLFLSAYDVFHLARARGVRLPGGRKVFSACETGATAEAVLQSHGLLRSETMALDPVQGVEMHIWRKP
jgi:hypothetical protein